MIRHCTRHNSLIHVETLEDAIENRYGVQIAAIDNGLAFPIHHPNRFRSYPYGWLSLPLATHPFSHATANVVLPLLTSNQWWQETLSGVETIFKLDSDFNEKVFKLQKSVLRGQCFNLIASLNNATIGIETPATLYSRPLMLVHEELEVETTLDRIK